MTINYTLIQYASCKFLNPICFSLDKVDNKYCVYIYIKFIYNNNIVFMILIEYIDREC